MTAIKYRELKRRYELDGPEKTVAASVARPWPKAQLKPEDFSIRELAEGLVPDGREWVRRWIRAAPAACSLLEAGEAST